MQPSSLLLSLSLAGLSAAHPISASLSSGVGVNMNMPQFNVWQPAGPNDSRGPCPALNTLANHGYINRNGRDISTDSIFKGMLQAFGMNQSAVAPALPNAFTTCQYLTGQDCAKQNTLKNLTLLSEPHAAEHDHSLSRQDYKEAYANGAATDNNAYNATIFQQVLDLIGSRTHVDFALANEIRLLRTSNQLQSDQPGWMSPEDVIKPVQSFELGFIFAVMADRSLPDAATNPQIRVDWWHAWFSLEALPTALGWTAPNPPREIDFVAYAAQKVYASTPSATPAPLPSGALGPAGLPAALPPTPAGPIYPLVTPKQASMFNPGSWGIPWPFGGSKREVS